MVKMAKMVAKVVKGEQVAMVALDLDSPTAAMEDSDLVKNDKAA